MKKLEKKRAFLRFNINAILFFLFICVMVNGCKKFVEVSAPITSTNGENVFTDDANAIAAVTGIYANMSSSAFSLNMSRIPELSSDNLKLINMEKLIYVPYYENSVNSSYSAENVQFWSNFYNYIYKTNAALEGLNNASTLTPAIKKRLLGECHFLRAFCYFYLVNLYGEVPLSLTTDYSINNKLSRSSSTIIYQKIIDDLLQAKANLDENYVDGTLIHSTFERVRPTIMTANALLSRVYLYTKNYSAAESVATEVINKTNLYSANITLDKVFLSNSLETIWALQPVIADINTEEAIFYTITSSGPNSINPVGVSDDLLKSFEVGDKRKDIWINTIHVESENYRYVAKYKVPYGSSTITEYPIVFRLGEQYLIRSEARAEQNNIQGSQSDLNLIRTRAGLANTTAATVADLRDAILKERRVEFFAEWGDRWFDIKRTGRVDQIMHVATPMKGGIWFPYKSLYPIPSTEILYNNNLKQNTGY